MKKLFLITYVLLLSLQLTGAYAIDCNYNLIIENIESKNLLISDEIAQTDAYLSVMENKDTHYYTKLINKLGKKINYLENEIEILNNILSCEEINGNCKSQIKFNGDYDDSSSEEDIKSTILNEVSIRKDEISKTKQEKKDSEKIQKELDEIEVFFEKLEDSTSKYPEDKKAEHYGNIVLKIDNIIQAENQNKSIEILLNALKEKLNNYLNEYNKKKNLIIFDKTSEFYKNSLQQKVYSCEISVTSDILSTIKKENITEDELIEKIDKSKFDETASYSNGIRMWGNPDEGFVGYIDKDSKGKSASQRNLTGYGVYEKPIEKLYNSYGLKTEIINNTNYTSDFGPKQHLNKILTEFSSGNYVQLWGDICTTSDYDDGELELSDIKQEDVDNGKNAKNSCWSFGQDRKIVWYYEEDGKLIKHQGLIGEHNFYLLGYEGELENPTNIIIWDASTGKHIYPIDEWLRKWEEMDFRSIIIYND
ncbi:MAG: hypothetical protein PHN31_05645 [Candidatus Gracilibacteria bacterium]|nr:hypothetical protein [Candidatus Gracilibacteria bacterium]